MKNILLITGVSEQYYFQPFAEKCRERNMRIFILDPFYIPTKGTLSVTMDNARRISGFIDVLEYVTGDMKKIRLSLSDINVAWYLREGVDQSKTNEKSIQIRFAENESMGALRSLFSVLECKWVNRKETIHFLSSNKFYQQLVARQCGLAIPDTLISNDPESVAVFSKPVSDLLFKCIGYMKLDEAGQYFLYSQQFPYQELIENKEAIRGCPIFVQEYIQKRYEHRVMVIGERVLSCKIDSQASEKTKVDWRHYDFKNVAHTPSELPVPVQKALKCFMRKIDLKYGAIDLIETPEGNFVFLEVNPSGQWGWIADLAGLPIPEAVADMLESL